ncbi:MAG: hypothetical protein WBQ44_10130 [Rhodococcus sp. (in: high G+C Gram-positive bacteria)]
MRQHGLNHADIGAFRIRLFDAPSTKLRETERSLVHSAEKAGFTLRNREHAAVIIGSSSLDHVVSPAEQDDWLKDPSASNRSDGTVGVTYSDSQLAAHNASHERLKQHPRYPEVVRALGAYLDACVPFPARTEGTFWTVSCYPGSSKSLILRLSMGMLETFYILENPKSGLLEVTMFVDGRHLPAPKLLSRWKLWRKLSKHVQTWPGGHKSAGAFEQTVVIDDVHSTEEALRIPGVAMAAASHALAVMRKRQSGYKISHCPQLASAGTAALGLETVDSQPASDPVGESFSERIEITSLDTAVSDDKGADKLGAFVSADSSGDVRRHLSDLVHAALPDGRDDVGVHWGLTCMPSTSAGRGRKRLYTLNVGRIEVGYGVASTQSGEAPLIGTIVVSASELEERTGSSIDSLRRTHKRLSFDQHGYVAAKGDDVSIRWGFDAESLAQLDLLPWREAVAVLADALRTSRCPYAKYHSHILLDELAAQGEVV